MERAMKTGTERRLQIVMVSRDVGLFSGTEHTNTETQRRHLHYLELLRERLPSVELRVIVVGKSHKPAQENLCASGLILHGLNGHKILQGFKLLLLLYKLRSSAYADKLLLVTQVIYQEGVLTLAFAKVFRLRCVGQVHEDIFHSSAYKRSQLQKASDALVLPFFSSVRVVSKYLENNIKFRAPNLLVRTIPVAMKLGIGDFPQPCAADSVSRILYVGRFVHDKNLEFWIDIATELKKLLPVIEFEWVGSGPLERQLYKQITAAGLQNSFTLSGFLTGEDLSSAYKRASVFLFTSHSEGFGRVLVESLSYAIPAIAPRLPSTEFIIKDGITGLLYDATDARVTAGFVAGLCEKLISDPQRRVQMGERSRADVLNRFSKETLSRQWVDFLLESAD